MEGKACREEAGEEAGKAVFGQWGPVEGLSRRVMRRHYLCPSHSPLGLTILIAGLISMSEGFTGSLPPSTAGGP